MEIMLQYCGRFYIIIIIIIIRGLSVQSCLNLTKTFIITIQESLPSLFTQVSRFRTDDILADILHYKVWRKEIYTHYIMKGKIKHKLREHWKDVLKTTESHNTRQNAQIWHQMHSWTIYNLAAAQKKIIS